MASLITVTTSKQFSINWQDISKGILMAILTPAVLIIQQSISAGQFTFNWKQIGMAALAGGIGYIIKNFFTPAQTIVKGLNDGTTTLSSGTDQPRPTNP